MSLPVISGPKAKRELIPINLLNLRHPPLPVGEEGFSEAQWAERLLGQSVGQLRAMLEKGPLLEPPLVVALACCAREGVVPSPISVSSKQQLHSNKTVRLLTERTACA
jgi:hypothetical protein